jgi:hypothetical protein
MYFVSPTAGECFYLRTLLRLNMRTYDGIPHDTFHAACLVRGLLEIKLNRRQFPIQLAFAMTINKAQGQTVKHIGIDLRQLSSAGSPRWLTRGSLTMSLLWLALARAGLGSGWLGRGSPRWLTRGWLTMSLLWLALARPGRGSGWLGRGSLASWARAEHGHR